MADVQVNLRLSPGLLAELDLRRDDVPRNVWITRAVEERLRVENEAVLERIAPRSYRGQPGPDVTNVRSSAQSKRDVQPIPKGKP